MAFTRKEGEERRRIARIKTIGGNHEKFICPNCGVRNLDEVAVDEQDIIPILVCSNCFHSSVVAPYSIQAETDWKLSNGYLFFTPKGELFECPSCGCKTYKPDSFLGNFCTNCKRTFKDPDVYTK